MTEYQVHYTYGGRREVRTYATKEQAIAFKNDFAKDIFNVVIRIVDSECVRCQSGDSSDVPHFNCMYQGKAIGHSKAHCTANACW